MVIIVVPSFEKGSPFSEQLQRTLDLARASGVADLVIASDGSIPAMSGIGLITFSDRYALGSAISEFIHSQSASKVASSHVTIVSAEISSLSNSSAAMQRLIAAQAPLSYIPTFHGSETVEFPGMNDAGFIASQLVQDIQPETMIPAVGLSVARALLDKVGFACISLSGLALELVVECFSRGEEVQLIDSDLSVASDFAPVQISNDELARGLRRAVELIAIEELFPAHAWDARRPESTMSCYHRLAAKFIRLGDFESADSCLNQSDRIAESPRALALRAVIAMERGETLGAIAKLITSLQEYEQQKRNASVSKLEEGAGQPIDSVNEELKQGLSALNSQDNSAALKHFARAVREFDSFYRESGLLTLM